MDLEKEFMVMVCRGGIVRMFVIDRYTLLYSIWIINKDILYSTWNCAQYYACMSAHSCLTVCNPMTVATRLLCPWSGEQEGKHTDSGGHSANRTHQAESGPLVNWSCPNHHLDWRIRVWMEPEQQHVCTSLRGSNQWTQFADWDTQQKGFLSCWTPDKRLYPLSQQ